MKTINTNRIIRAIIYASIPVIIAGAYYAYKVNS